MVERIRVFKGSTELNIAGGSISQTDDYVVDSGIIQIEGDTSVEAGSVLDFKKSDGITNIFSAKVINKKRENPLWKIPLFTNGWELMNLRIEQVYTDKSPEYIVEDIITNYTQNLNYASTATSGVTINGNYIARGYLIDVIVEMMVLVDWKAKNDFNDNFFFEPKGTTNTGRVLTNGEDFQVKNWDDGDIRTIINHVKVVCGNITTGTTETVSGTGTEFILSHKPKGVLRVTVGGTEIEGDVNNTNYSVDAENKKVIFTITRTDPSFEYEYDEPIVVEDQDDASIAEYEEVFKEVHIPSIDNFVNARRFARQFLNIFSQPQVSCKGSIADFDFDLEVNEEITVIDSPRNKEETLVVNKKTYVIDGGRTDVELGPRKFDYGDRQREVETRIKKLERAIQNDEDPVFARTISNDLNIDVVEVVTPSVMFPNDSFVLGHDTLGRLRTDLNFEADCSNTGNHGTWNGTGIGGAQYVSPAWTSSIGEWRLRLPVSEGGLDDKSYKTVVDGSSLDGVWKIIAGCYYPFNGNADDASESGNDGTIVDSSCITLTTDHLGNEDNAYNFTGQAGKYISIPTTSMSASSGTVAVWFNTSITSTNPSFLFGHYNSGNRIYIFHYQNSGRLRFQMGDGNGYINPAVTINDGAWHQAIITWNGTTFNSHIDGVLVDENRAYSGLSALGATAYIGDNPPTGGAEFEGDISDVLVLDVALSEEESTHLYNVTKVHKLDKPLVTKIDVNGDSITGFEFTGQASNVSGSGLNWGTYAELPNLGIAGDTTVSYYGKFMMSSDLAKGINEILFGGRWSISETVFINSNSKLVFLQDNTSLTHDTVLNRGQIYQYLITFDYNSVTPADSEWNIYVANNNGVVIGSTKSRTGQDGFSSEAQQIGMERRYGYIMRGVIAKPTVFNKVLDTSERNALFSGQPVENLYLGGNGPRLSYGAFNGTDNYITSSDEVFPTGTTKAAISILVKFDTFSQNHCVYYRAFGNSIYPRIVYQTSTDTLYFQYFLDSQVQSIAINNFSSNYSVDKWYCLQANMDVATGGEFFIDNVSVGTDDTTGASLNGGAFNTMVGYDNNLGYYLKGQADEYLIFNTTLSSDERLDIIENRFDSTHAKYANCKLWYSFDNPRLGDRFTSKLPTEDIT